MKLDLLRPGDRTAVRRIFRDTLIVGSPHPFTASDYGRHLAAYEQLCLGWYLGPGAGHAAVLRSGRDVVGYTLVCVDEDAFARWQRRHAVRLVRTVLPRLVLRHLPPVVDRFYRLRLRDGWASWRHQGAPPAPAHAHVNVEGDAGFAPGRLLAEHVDAVCRIAGIESWYGEVNAPRGRRAAALERWGVRVVDRVENHTFSWLCGTPIDRLTIVRPVPTAPAVRPPATRPAAA
jgi:hypothetical protein